ncbi:hypothetical protein [Nonomuraea endophytica]|uniref:hypothetical protein n=1 Tax=Nonomuraea endophytica TaxID=714136 RepID=UPI0037CC3A55
MAGLIVLVALAACQPAESKPAAETRPSFTASVDPSASVKDALLTAYRGMWRDFADAARTADWNDPELADHATGDAEAKLRYGLYLASKKGQIVKGEPRLLRPEITKLEREKAAIADCVDDTGFLVYAKDGKRAKDTAGAGRHLATATLKLREGSWYVTSYTLKEAGTC